LFVDSCVEEEIHEALAEVVVVVSREVLGALMKLHHDGPVLVIVVEDLKPPSNSLLLQVQAPLR
jgi:hypothetical protein